MSCLVLLTLTIRILSAIRTSFHNSLFIYDVIEVSGSVIRAKITNDHARRQISMVKIVTFII